ncbi:MAG: hypothetical protein A2Y17_01130 [Clostridiales bacterium GWF2_38_85]|nr:MAG: hypothetical protein A2Y17_01130 [Clostridiales bacterium GWF2_38_85]
MNLKQYYLTQNNCYKVGQKHEVKAIMVHSTGANNPMLKRYVGPDDGLLGVNKYNNHWNAAKPGGQNVCVHAFVGKLQDGSIATYQTLPWDYVGWHSGTGSLGSSRNANNTDYIGFEICEDNLTDAAYFGKVYKEAIELCVYEKGEDGTPVIIKEEAETVRLIYQLFLEGKTPAGICRLLDKRGTPTPSGKQKWSQTTVNSILTNEKYKGDALLQKRFTVDFLMKKMKVNEGEVPQYYVEHSHDAIISPTDWDIVQVEIDRRKTLGRAYSGNSIFSSKLVCGDCGGFFGQKVWHSTDAYRKVIWRCNSKFKSEKKCSTPHLDTDTIQQKFLLAYNRLMENRDGVIDDCKLIRRTLSDSTGLDAEIDKLTEEIEVVAEMIKACVKENASAVHSQEEYNKKYKGLVKRYEKATRRLDELSAERTRKQERDRELRLFIESIKKQPLVLQVWNERLWVGLLERATVFHDDRMVFKFKNGIEIEVEL